jgi:hypothetical protein
MAEKKHMQLKEWFQKGEKGHGVKANEEAPGFRTEEDTRMLIDCEYTIKLGVMHRLYEMAKGSFNAEQVMALGTVLTQLGMDSEGRDWKSNPSPTDQEFLKLTESILALGAENRKKVSAMMIRFGWLPPDSGPGQLRLPGVKDLN